ncbi:MAG: hypothetical protein ABR562_02420 [Thermoplasmatota archaeon]
MGTPHDYAYYGPSDTYDAHWSTDTGIVLQWSTSKQYPNGPIRNEGHIVASNVLGQY